MRTPVLLLALTAALATPLRDAAAADVLAIAPPAGVVAKPGTTAQIKFQVTVKPGYHIQANPVENPNLIPVTLQLDATDAAFAEEPVYPRAKRMRLPGD